MTEDILERAKDLRHYLAHKAEWQDESVIVQELIAEVERLRSENKIISDRAAHHDRQDAKEIELLAARIAELEAGKLMYEEIAESYQIGVDDLRAYIKRLEAAFLEQFVQGIQAPREMAELMAREALERIKAETGSGDHVAGANKLILTAEQREEEGKRDA